MECHTSFLCYRIGRGSWAKLSRAVPCWVCAERKLGIVGVGISSSQRVEWEVMTSLFWLSLCGRWLAFHSCFRFLVTEQRTVKAFFIIIIIFNRCIETKGYKVQETMNINNLPKVLPLEFFSEMVSSLPGITLPRALRGCLRGEMERVLKGCPRKPQHSFHRIGYFQTVLWFPKSGVFF